MKKLAKLLSATLALCMITSAIAGCSKKENTPQGNSSNISSQKENAVDTSKVDTSKEVNLVYYLYGSEGVANKDIIAEINKKMKADINATLEVKYIDWGDISTKYPLLFASGESFDMSHAAPSTVMPYSTLVKQGALADITEMLDTVAPTLKKELSDFAWNATRIDGKIYAVPNKYSEFTPYGFITRRDLVKKYNVEPVTSLATMEAYLDAAKKDGTYVPLNGSSNLAMDMYRMFIDLTGTWIPEVPGIPTSEMYLVSESADKYTEIFHPAFKDEFEDFAVKMKEWANKGYWSKDILSSQQDDKDNFINNISASFVSHMSDWSGNYGNINAKLPGVETDFWCFAEGNNKIRKVSPDGALTAISENSKNKERALMAIEKFLTDESYYRLMQYGIEGRQYEVVDGIAAKPKAYNDKVDGGGFAAWALRNDRFNIPYASEDPRRYELIEKWNKTAIDKPYVGFSFNPSNVSTEIASIANVNATYGIPILLGRSPLDAKAAVKEYREQLDKAGVNKVIDEVKSQLSGFTKISG